MKKLIIILLLLVGCSQTRSDDIDLYGLSYLELNDGSDLYDVNLELDEEIFGTWIIDSEDMTYRSILVLYPSGTAWILEDTSYGFSTRIFQYKTKGKTLILMSQTKDWYSVPYYLVWELNYQITSDEETVRLVLNDRVYVKAEDDRND